MHFEDKLIENLDFGRSGLNSSVFEKLFVSYSCIFFIKQCVLRSFCIKMLCFSKIWFFQTFNRTNLFFDQSKLRLKFLVWVCLTQLMFNRFSINCNWKISSLYVFDQIFFYASFVFRIHMHCIVFVSILQFCSHIFHCYIRLVTFMPRVCRSHHSFIAIISRTEKLSLFNYNNFSFHNLNQYQVNLPPLPLVQVSVNK